jgi:hypothetical protein
MAKDLGICYIPFMPRMTNPGEDREMKCADKESITTMPDFTAAERTRVPSATAGRARPDDVNNNLRLLVDAVRRLTEVIATHVYLPFPYVSHDLIFGRLIFRLVTGLSNLDQVQMTWIKNRPATGFGFVAVSFLLRVGFACASLARSASSVAPSLFIEGQVPLQRSQQSVPVSRS